jgi:hypothetical protein
VEMLDKKELIKWLQSQADKQAANKLHSVECDNYGKASTSDGKQKGFESVISRINLGDFNVK